MYPGVIFTRAGVPLALLSLRTNKGLLVVYKRTEGVAKCIQEKKTKYIKNIFKFIQTYIQKIRNEVHYVPSQHGQIEKNYTHLGSNELSL